MEKFLRHVQRPPERSGCWLWTGAITYDHGEKSGYGKMGVEGKTLPAHRVSYELFTGPIPAGLEIDHVCHDPRFCDGGNSCLHRRCVNPLHLKLTTPAGNCNLQRANYSRQGLATAQRQRAKTHCPSGHEYSRDNTYLDAKGFRHCRVCYKLRALAKREGLAG